MPRPRLFIMMLLCGAIVARGSIISISGTIVDKMGGSPVDSVRVSTVLFNAESLFTLSGYTDNQGRFLINGNYTPLRNFASTQPLNNNLRLTLKRNSIVFEQTLRPLAGIVAIFSADGKKIFSASFDAVSGKKRVLLPRLSAGLTIMCLTIGRESFTHTLFCLGDLIYFGNGSNEIQTSGNALLAKRASIVDTLIGVKPGFIDAKVPIDSYSKQNVTVALSKGVCGQLFKVKNTDIPNWKLTPGSESFTIWSASRLPADIDGAAELYTSRGMLQAVDISMVGPNEGSDANRLAQHSLIMDFGTMAKAMAMYRYCKSEYFIDAGGIIPGYSDSLAFYQETLAGITAYSYYKQFYFELNLSGFSQTQKAVATARMFLEFFKESIDTYYDGKNLIVSMLKVTNTDIANWKMASSADSFTLWNANNFDQDIDGGYEKYTDRGMIEAADFHMLGPIGSDGEQNQIATRSFIMDFGTDSNAEGIYNYWKTENSQDAFDIPGYGNTNVFAIPIQGGITVYAYFSKFYFELKFLGFSTQAQAVATAKQFLDLFKGKIE
jgi:hypothetical protein